MSLNSSDSSRNVAEPPIVTASPASSPTPPAAPAKGSRQLDVQRLPDHRDRLFRAAYAMCGRREDAEDLVQDTYLRVLKRSRFLRRDDDLGYLLRVLRNTWINAYKARARRPATVQFDESIDFVLDPSADPWVTVGEVRTLYATVHQLPDALRETLVAVDVVGLSYRQAARALDVPQGTIMSRLYRARNQVAEQLEREAGAPGSQAWC